MFAEIIVDISHEKVDRPFEYIIPDELEGQVRRGSQVNIPFGRSNKLIRGFILDIKDKASFDVEKLKSIDSVVTGSTTLEGSMIELADFIRTNYGSTMNQALKIVLPIKKSASPVVEKYIFLEADDTAAQESIEKYTKDKRSAAKLRLLSELVREKVLPYQIVRDKLNISAQTLKALEKEGLIRVDSRENLRDALKIKA
ncbi:MAG: primosomal protein N', partial [Lachnospiraceae bacterium]|nr:primosomal protein N' [Lachnospiraceae bacterium]